jgi:hypothetical protein
LFDVGENFVIKRILERLQGLGHRLGIGVLLLEVLNDLGIRLVAKPVVVVDHNGAVAGFFVFDDRRDGWLHRLPGEWNGGE